MRHLVFDHVYRTNLFTMPAVAWLSKPCMYVVCGERVGGELGD